MNIREIASRDERLAVRKEHQDRQLSRRIR
jgi:hypothetical protein